MTPAAPILDFSDEAVTPPPPEAARPPLLMSDVQCPADRLPLHWREWLDRREDEAREKAHPMRRASVTSATQEG
jgi:hypothetical protein